MKTKRLFLVVAAFFLLLSMSGQSSKSSANTGVLSAGIARVDITPDIPVMLYGYASRKTLSEGIHDHLFARAVAFENGGKKLVMVSSDLGSYTDTLYTVIKKSIMVLMMFMTL